MNKLQLSIKTLLFALLMIFANQSLKASECYHYHTATEYNLLKTDGQLYLEKTVKDPNKISIVSYEKVLLKGVFPGDAIIFDETRDAIVIKNNIWYYYILKDSFYDSSVLIDQLLEVQTQTAPPIGLTFFMNSSWNKLNYNSAYTTREERVKFIPVKNIPSDGILMASYFSGSNPVYLVKDKKKVYSYDESTGEVEILENLNPKTAKIDTLDANSDELCIYDDRSFYMTRDNFRTVEDMTPQFKSMNLKHNFLKLKFHQPNSFRTYLDFQDGNLWSYVSAGISLDEGGAVNFYKVENAKYLESSGLVLHKGFLYDDPWDLVNEVQPIHLPKTGKIEDFTLTIDGRYRNGGNLYEVRNLNDGSRIFEKIENARIVANDAVRMHNNSLWSYQNGTGQFYLTPNAIEFYNHDTQEIVRSIKHRSA